MGFATAAVLAVVLVTLLGRDHQQLRQTNSGEQAHQRSLLWGPQLQGENGLIDSAEDWARRNFKREMARHASAHLFYRPPQNSGKIKAWFHILSPRQSADDTYFAVLGNGYGYFGLQQVRGFPWFEGKVVFSMWDQAGFQVKVLECGHGTFCTRFGGEGTGAKTYKQFNKWKLGNQYGFMIRNHDVGSTMVRQEAYLFAAELGGWVLMSVLEVVKEDAQRPWDIQGMYSFVEQWSPRDFGDARWARLGPSFVQYEGEGGWQQLRASTFRAGSKSWENSENCDANVTDLGRRWGLGIGGDVGAGQEDRSLTVIAAEELPTPLVIFDRLTQEGKLPRGCAGGTCTNLFLAEWYYWLFSPSNLGRTCVIAGILVALAFSARGAWSVCCHPDDDDQEALRRGLQEVTCPAGHGLTTFLTPNPTFWCDGCGQRVPQGTTMQGCRRCKYDKCKACVAQAIEAMQGASQGDRASRDAHLFTEPDEAAPRASRGARVSREVHLQPAVLEEVAQARAPPGLAEDASGGQVHSGEADKV